MSHLSQRGAVVLVSCYELGHAPHSLAVLAGFLSEAGFEAEIVDLQVERLDLDRLAAARLVAISVPMHTALRLAMTALERIRAASPDCHICVFGLYAPLNAEMLRSLGADSVLGGECEPDIVDIARDIDQSGRAPGRETRRIARLAFPAPRRERLLGASHYAHFIGADGEPRLAGYTETTRGCLDVCRHCPVPAVYGGRFFVVDRRTVLADIDEQVAGGVEHITFGDPDFLNGPKHGMAIVRDMHRAHPDVTFDVTAQIAHLLAHTEAVAELPELGCAFVVSAAESLSDEVLSKLGKRHRRADLLDALELCDSVGLPMRPTFVTFTPWTTMEDMVQLCELIAERDLIEHVAPVQLSVRLLVPHGSLLLSRPELADCFSGFDPRALTHTWRHPDPRMDALQADIARAVERAAQRGAPDAETFEVVRDLVHAAAGLEPPERTRVPRPRRRVPRLSEPWFC